MLDALYVWTPVSCACFMVVTLCMRCMYVAHGLLCVPIIVHSLNVVGTSCWSHCRLVVHIQYCIRFMWLLGPSRKHLETRCPRQQILKQRGNISARSWTAKCIWKRESLANKCCISFDGCFLLFDECLSPSLPSYVKYSALHGGM